MKDFHEIQLEHRGIQLEHRERIESASASLPAHLRKRGVTSFGEVDRIVQPFCRIHERDDPESVRALLRQLVQKAHGVAIRERSRRIRAHVAEQRFEAMKSRIDEFSRALEPALMISKREDWRKLHAALVTLPGILDDMEFPRLKAPATALLEILLNLQHALCVDDARIQRGRGRAPETYPTAVIKELTQGWLAAFPGELRQVSEFSKSPRSKSGLFALFARAAWHDLGFESDELTIKRLNSAILDRPHK